MNEWFIKQISTQAITTTISLKYKMRLKLYILYISYIRKKIESEFSVSRSKLDLVYFKKVFDFFIT